MGAALIPFAFEGSPVRVVEHDGANAFIAGDVARILGYRDAEKLTRILPNDEKGTRPVGTLGGEQAVSVITEPGLYRAIVQRQTGERMDADVASAIIRFQRWVFHEVLPSIRRTGSYTSATAAHGPKDVASAFRSYAGIARLIGLDRNQAALAANRATIATTGVDALALLGSTHLVAPQQERILTPTEIGREFGGESGRSVNFLLQRHGFQTGPDWSPTDTGRPFAVFQDTGKKHGNGTPVRQLKWTADIVPALQAAIAATAS